MSTKEKEWLCCGLSYMTDFSCEAEENKDWKGGKKELGNLLEGVWAAG